MSKGSIESKRRKIIELHKARPNATDKAIADRLGVSIGFVKRTRTLKAVPTIYALKCQSFIKIGSTLYLSSRLTSIQTACPYPVELVNYWQFEDSIKNVRVYEKCWHSSAWEFKQLNEWFVDCVAFRSVIDNYAKELSQFCTPFRRKWVMEICK